MAPVAAAHPVPAMEKQGVFKMIHLGQMGFLKNNDFLFLYVGNRKLLLKLKRTGASLN